MAIQPRLGRSGEFIRRGLSRECRAIMFDGSLKRAYHLTLYWNGPYAEAGTAPANKRPGRTAPGSYASCEEPRITA